MTCGDTSADPLGKQLVAAGVDEQPLKEVFVGNLHALAARFLRDEGAEVVGLTRFCTRWTWEQAVAAMEAVWAADGSKELSGPEIPSLIARDAWRRRTGAIKPCARPNMPPNWVTSTGWKSGPGMSWTRGT